MRGKECQILKKLLLIGKYLAPILKKHCVRSTMEVPFNIFFVFPLVLKVDSAIQFFFIKIQVQKMYVIGTGYLIYDCAHGRGELS